MPNSPVWKEVKDSELIASDSEYCCMHGPLGQDDYISALRPVSCNPIITLVGRKGSVGKDDQGIRPTGFRIENFQRHRSLIGCNQCDRIIGHDSQYRRPPSIKLVAPVKTPAGQEHAGQD